MFKQFKSGTVASLSKFQKHRKKILLSEITDKILSMWYKEKVNNEPKPMFTPYFHHLQP